MLKEQVALRTLAWADIDKITFLWDYDLVIVFVDREYNTGMGIITEHDPEVLEEIYTWLGSDPTLPANPFEFEGEYGAEENRD